MQEARAGRTLSVVCLLAVAFATGCGGKKQVAASADAGVGGQPASGGAPAAADDQPLPRTRIDAINVEDLTPPEMRAIPIDMAPLEAAVKKSLADSDAFVAEAAAGGVPHRLEVRVVAQTAAKKAGKPGKKATGPGVVQVLIEAELVPKGDPEIAARVSRGGVEREFDFSNVDAVKDRLAADLERAVVGTLASLIGEERLRSGDAAEIQAALSGNDPELRMLAVRYAGTRKNRSLVERLIGFLKDPDPDMRDSAIGALVEIGDRRAVKPLTDLVEFKDLDGMRRILDAVAALGGDDAQSYLELVASGHDDPRIQYLAKDALQRLTKRAAPE